MLPERLPHALGDAAMGLPMNDQRIDAAADVVDRRVALDIDGAGFGIDLDLADAGAVRKYRRVHLIVAANPEPTGEFVRQVVPLGLLCELRTRSARWLLSIALKTPSSNSIASGGTSDEMRHQRLALGDQVLRGQAR